MIFSGYLCHIEENKHTKSYENKGEKKFMYMAMLVALTLAFPVV